MAVISPSTFDPLRRYVSVRLAQGVPLVDADWNEKEDIRRFELRAFLKWFVGDGVPHGNDGFRIVATGATDGFTITAGGGGGALDAGRLLVDGIEVFITSNLGFTAQRLHSSQPGAAALAAAWSVPVVAPLPAPPAAGTTRTLTAYLDVWERLVTPAEDPNLIHAGLGTESCSRLRYEWVVRVRQGTTVPASGDPDLLPGHSYCALARIQQDSTGAITAAAISDLRRRGVVVPSRLDFQQLLTDTFGSGYSLDGTGVAQLAFSLRDVLNAILRERPAGVGPLTVLSGGPFNTPAAVIDNTGVPWLFWVRVAGANRFLAFSRRIAGTWTPAQDAFQITSVLSVTSVAAAAQPDGSLRVFYSGQAGNSQIFSRRFAGTWGAEEVVQDTDENIRLTAAVDDTGTIIVGWQSTAGAVTTAQTRRYPVGAPPAAVQSAGVMDRPGDLALIIDPSGAPQLIYVQQPNPIAPDWPIFSKRWIGGAWEPNFTATGITVPVQTFVELVATYTADGSLWTFYTTQGSGSFSRLLAKRLIVGVTEVRELIPPNTTPRLPTLVVDAQGNVQLFYQNGANLQQVGFMQGI
jgi:hypothetical protein